MDPIVIATGNPHKVDELRAILSLRGIPVVGLRDLPGHDGFQEPSETGTTFEENATIKATSYARQTGRVCLADDSGLEVDALGGAPGVISSHYSTDGQETGLGRAERDAANNQRLLRELAGVAPERRSARFVCVMCLAGFDTPAPSGAGVPPALHRGIGRALEIRHHVLPHWERGGSTYFVTFRVKTGTLADAERRVVADACMHWHGSRMAVHLAVVMPDHVHLIITPLRRDDGDWHPLRSLIHSIKSFTSHEIGLSRGTRGGIWQSAYYDRLIRDESEFQEKYRYVWENPVRAGLVAHTRDYPHVRVQPAQRIGMPGECGRDARTTDPGVLATSRGAFEGRIGLPGDVPRGTGGFGYDPLFLLPFPDIRSSAELSPEEKNSMSHRGKAAAAMAAEITRLLGPSSPANDGSGQRAP